MEKGLRSSDLHIYVATQLDFNRTKAVLLALALKSRFPIERCALSMRFVFFDFFSTFFFFLWSLFSFLIFFPIERTLTSILFESRREVDWNLL